MFARIKLKVLACLSVAFISSSSYAIPIDFQEDVLPTTAYQTIAVDIRSRSDQADRNRELAADGTSPVTAFWFGRIAENDVVRALLGFNLSSIPDGSTIDSISLTLYARGNDGTSQDRDYTISLHELVGAIIEGTGGSAETGTGPSWNSRDITGDPNVDWITPGGDYYPTVLSSVIDNPKTLVTNEPMVFESSPSFVAAAQSALEGTGTLYMLLRASSEETSATERAFFNMWSDDGSGTLGAGANPKLTIQYTSGPDLVLHVDRDTGNLILENPTSGALDLVGYSITSVHGSLDRTAWLSIAENYDIDGPNTVHGGTWIGSVDNNDAWIELTGSESGNDLSEFEPGLLVGDGATIAGGQTINLGDGAWLPSFAEDLEAEILLASGEVRTISVFYSGNNGEPFLFGDIAGGGAAGNRPDGVVDFLDWQAFQAGFGMDISNLPGTAAYLAGDFTGDLDHTMADFQAFKQAYEDANGPGSFAAILAGVPEPSTVWLGLLIALGMVSWTRRRSIARNRLPWLNLAACLGLFLACATSANADMVWGTHITSNNFNAPIHCDPPTALFSFDTSDIPGSFADHGNLLLNGLDVRVEGLAVKSTGLCVGFVIDDSAMSQMVYINGGAADGNSSTPVSMHAVGSNQSYFATGAAYDKQDRLWVVDNVTGTLYEINDADGSVISSLLLTNDAGNTTNYAAVNRSSLDIAFNSQGIGYLLQYSESAAVDALWRLNTSTGVLVEIDGSFTAASGDGRQMVALAVDPGDDDLFYGLGVNGVDQITRYSISAAPPASNEATNVFNLQAGTGIAGGRGDMANGSETLLATEQITLEVNTITGQARFVSTGLFDIDMDGYRIVSQSNALNPSGWYSLEEQSGFGDGIPGNGIGWEELAAFSSEVAEGNLTGSSVLSPNASVSLGALFATGGGPLSEDLVLELSLANGSIIGGLVKYVTSTADNPDFDGDGDVDGADFLVWQRGFGLAAASQAQGDANGDTNVDGADLVIWKSQFGMGGASSGNPMGSAIPEPNTFSLMGLVFTSLVMGFFFRKGKTKMDIPKKVFLLWIGALLGLVQVASANVTTDRLYLLGDDPSEIVYEGGSIFTTYDSEVTDTIFFSDQQNLDDLLGTTVYTNVGTGGLERPGVVSATAWGGRFNGVDSHLEGKPLNRPDETAGPTPIGEGPLLDGFPFNYDGITARGLQMWVYPDQAGLNTNTRQVVVMDTIAAGGVAITADGYWTQINDRHIHDTDIGVTTPVVGDTWYHVMHHIYRSADPGAPAVIPGSGSSNLGFTSVVYVNGIAVSANNETPSPGDLTLDFRTGWLTVGAAEVTYLTYDSYFRGVVDDVEMYVYGDNSGATGPPAGQDYGTFDLFSDNDWIADAIATAIPGGVLLPGDVNRDGLIDDGDVDALVDGWLKEKRFKGFRNEIRVGDWETWGWGDLNLDGQVRLSDAFILHSALLAAGQGGFDFSLLDGAGVPEPATWILLLIGLVFAGRGGFFRW